MKKEASGKKGKLWLWIVIAVVLVAAIVVGIIFLPGLLGNQEEADDGMPKLYWNVDREENTDWDTGLSIRQPAEDGNYYVRFAHNGEQVEIPVADKKLVNYIDSLDLMGLTLDENGFAIDVKPVTDIASAIGESVYVQNISGDTIIANSSVAMNGRKLTIKLTETAKIYNVSGKGEFVGEAIETSELNPMDTISIYGTLVPEDSEEEPVVTHIFVLNKPAESAIYFRADQFYDSTNKVTTREPDENGAYTIKWYCNGEIVDLKCKDKDLVSYFDSANYHWCHWGLEFDEDGYIIGYIDSFLGSRTLLQCERYDITELDENGNYTATSLIKNNGAYVQGTVGADCPIYDISSTAKAEGQVNRRVDSLQLGDRVCIWTDTMGNPVQIYITRRQADSVGYWVVTRSYSSATGQTTRTPNENGYYEIELLKAGDTKNTIYYTKDIEIATAVDASADRCVGLYLGEDNIIKGVYDIEAVFGYTYMVRGYFVIDASASVCTLLTPSGKGSTKNGVLALGAKVWNVSTVGNYGEETTLQVGDYVYAGKTAIGEVAYAYVVRRPLENGENKFYWRIDTRQYDSVNKVTTREPDADGYYTYLFANNGKQVTLRTNNKDFATLLDAQSSCPAFALETKGDIITAVHEGTYAYGGTRYNQWTVMAVNGNELSVVSSSGAEGTWIVPDDCKIYNVSNSFSSHKGEQIYSIKVGDILANYRDIYASPKVLIVKSRETNKMAWPVDPQYDSTNAVTTRTADENGWYKVKLAVDGKVREYVVKSKTVMSAIDSYTAPFGVQVSGNEILYTSTTTYVENVKGAGVTGYTVKSASGSTVNVIYTLGHSENTGQSETLTLSSNVKIYDVTSEAMANGTFGQSVKLKAGDLIRTFTDDEDGSHLYVYVIARNTREYYSYCDHCQQKVYWTPYVPTSNVVAYDSHYYLASDNMELTSQFRVYSTARDFETVLDLNGHSAYREGGRVALVRYGDTFTIIDSVGGGALYSVNNTSGGGVFMVNGSKTTGIGVLNLLAGKYYMQTGEDVDQYTYSAGVLTNSGIVNMYDGVEIFGGMVVARNASDGSTGGNVKNTSGGVFNMYGGKIYNGIADGQYLDTDGVTVLGASSRGGNVHNSGTFNMYDGEIYGGVAGRGGNVYVEAGTFTMYGGKIVDGVADKTIGGSKDGRGGNICSTGDVYLKGGIVSNGTVIGATYGGNIMTTGLNDCVYISDDATVVDGYYKKTADSEPTANNIYLMYSNMVISGGTVGNDADITVISTTGTDTGGGCSLIISGGTITGKISLGGKVLEGAKYEDYRTALTLAGGNVPGSIDASNVKELNISGNPKIGKLIIGNTMANMGAMTAGANIVVDAVGVISNPIADAAVANAIVNGNYLIPAAEGMVIQLTADNELKILHPLAVSGPCEHCDGANADWIPWDGTSGGNGHFVVNEDITLEDMVTVSGDMILDLNGKTITAAEGKQAFRVNGTFSIVDSSEAKTGTLTGGAALDSGASTYYQRGGNVCVSGGTFNLYSGTISNGTALSRGGNLYVTGGGVINIYGGTVIGGETGGLSNNIYVMYSTLNVYGGEIIDTSTNSYYNIRGQSYDGKVAKFNIAGGSITGNTLGLKVDGGELADVVISGGTIEGKLTVLNATVFTIEGNPVIETLDPSSDLVTIGVLTEGAQIGVNEAGVFTAPFADAASAEAAAAYIVIPAGMNVVVTDNNELEVKTVPAATVNKYCEHCQQNVEFAEWYGAAFPGAGHYILMDNVVLAEPLSVAEDVEIVLNLNGKTITGATGRGGAFNVYGDLIVVDSSGTNAGTITGGKGYRGGNIFVQKNGSFTLYSGSVTNGLADTALESGTTGSRGGNIFGNGGDVTLKGGIVSGGSLNLEAGNRWGGNIFMTGGTLTIEEGAVVTGGSAKAGGNIYLMYANLVMTGGEVSNGTVTDTADGIYMSGTDTSGWSTLNISGGIIDGTVYSYKTTNTVTVSGTAQITSLNLNGTVLNVGELAEGASIKVDATSGVFTDALTNANDVVGYFDAVDSAYNVEVSADNKLEVVADTTGEPDPDPTPDPDPDPEPTPTTVYCPHCETEVEWTAWDGTAATGHFYLTENVDLTNAVQVNSGKDFVLNLNGMTITADGCRAFNGGGGATLSIVDTVGTGVITGGNANGGRGGNIYATSANVKLYGGTIIGGTATADGDKEGHNVAVYNGEFVMNGDVTIGDADKDGHSLYLFNLTSVELTKGTVVGKAMFRGSFTVALPADVNIDLLVLRDVKISAIAERTDKITVKVSNAAGAFLKGVFTETMEDAETAATYFVSAEPLYAITVNADNKLELVDGCACGCGTPADQVVWQDANAYIAALSQQAENNTVIAESVHLKLSADLNITEIYGAKKQISIGADIADVNVTIDLNGFSWYSDYRMYIYEGCVLTFMDSSEAQSGIMSATGSQPAASGGVFINYGTLNIRGGTYTQPANGSKTAKGGVVYQSSGEFNLYYGTIIGGQAVVRSSTVDGAGGNIYIRLGTFNMYGGSIIGGTALGDAGTGGNVYIAYDSVFNMYGGVISGGVAAVEPDIYLNDEAVFNNVGGAVGALCPCGCNTLAEDVVWQDATEYMTALKDSGTGTITENVHLKLSADLNIYDIYGANKQISIGGADTTDPAYTAPHVNVTIDLNGYTWSTTHRLYIYADNVVTIMDSSADGTGVYTSTGRTGSGRVIISYGTLNLLSGTITMTEEGATNITTGGVVYLSGDASVFNMYGGSVVNGRADGDEGKGGNVYVRGGTTFNMYGGTISGGTAAQGSNIYVTATGTFNHEGGTVEDEANTVYYVPATA